MNKIFGVLVIIVIFLISNITIIVLSKEKADIEHKLQNQLSECQAKLDLCKDVFSTHLDCIYAGYYLTTAYIREDGGKWADGRSAKMYPVGPGMIAADWKTFPPGTILYVQGYGYGIVLDRGSAIKGRHLDLYFKNERDAINWGKRKSRIWVVGQIKVTGSKGKKIEVAEK